ncbi:uncharacterized protein LOC131893485 [Tigriopus californicus]|uniref:uncharacterized protein LOC131893485 n=1 Tax=Tigriopus californicus TaxID=6832 RepID=UPI0027DA2A92|nr:uncharacterized protein LOC131893485 [Tigriopus californicus]
MKIAAILFTLSLFLGWSSTDTLDNSIGIDDSHHCALEMHKAQAFRGRKFSIFGSKVRLRGLQKSLNTIGDCCWALYRHAGFQGRPMFMGSHVSISSIQDWGWRRAKIRSVKRLKSCNF